jgi:hypothetical protein
LYELFNSSFVLGSLFSFHCPFAPETLDFTGFEPFPCRCIQRGNEENYITATKTSQPYFQNFLLYFPKAQKSSPAAFCTANFRERKVSLITPLQNTDAITVFAHFELSLNLEKHRFLGI